jgi:hypothetical protein
MNNKTILKGAASLAALVAVGAAGFAISSGSNNSASASGAAATSTPATTVPGGSPPTAGQRPPGGPMGTPVTGTAAEKAKAAALAQYPGTVERVLKSPTGGYIVHVIQKDGSEVHVLVSATFRVTGTGTGGPPRGASPNTVPPAVTPPGSTSSS